MTSWSELISPDYSATFVFHPIEDIAGILVGIFITVMLMGSCRACKPQRRARDGRFVK